MMRRVLLILLGTLFYIPVLIAGPGGKIAKQLFDTPFGKVAMVILIIVLFPILVYRTTLNFVGTKKTKSDLNKMSEKDDRFDWIFLKGRISGIFKTVHHSWTKENMEVAAGVMTEWYWQNQQLVFLDSWKEKGLINHTDVRKINSIKPICLRVNNQHEKFENSRLVVAIEANMEDYLVKRDNGQVVEGKRGYHDVTTVWTFVLQKGEWILENIEESTTISDYVRQPNKLITETAI